jgi:exodeoxyribonuclease-5
MTDFDLTAEQQSAIDFVTKNCVKKKQVLLGGLAGTGKSTCLVEISQNFPDFAVCAFTGKACNVLRRKGLRNAATIHSTIFDVIVGADNEPEYTLKSKHKLGFGGFIVDEASMVSEELYDALSYYKIPMIFVGDHGQLEPVGTKFNLMQKPDIKLEKIHRNANFIARFAHHLRDGKEAEAFKCKDDTVKIVPRKSLAEKDLLGVDQIICAFNKTRVSINSFVRKKLGKKGIIDENERIICLKNNREFGIFNGMQVIVEKVFKNKIRFRDDNQKTLDIPIELSQFGSVSLAENANRDRNKGFFDYSYCITAHKSQGDEFDKILVIEEKCDLWDSKRWAYTAASRAKESIIWAK